VRQVATGSDVEVLPARDAALESPSFSPDGNYVFYLTRRPDSPNYRALFQVPSLGGTPRERAFDVDSRASFSPDGKQIARQPPPGGVRRQAQPRRRPDPELSLRWGVLRRTPHTCASRISW
jgi:Tol biopolymer transport system component